MRFKKPWKVNRWGPVATAMPRMLRALDQHPELGCLGCQQWFGRTTMLLQYWRGFRSLARFAPGKDLPPLEPWRPFKPAIPAIGGVGGSPEAYHAPPAVA